MTYEELKFKLFPNYFSDLNIYYHPPRAYIEYVIQHMILTLLLLLFLFWNGDSHNILPYSYHIGKTKYQNIVTNSNLIGFP